MKKFNIVKNNDEFNTIINNGKCYKNSMFVLYMMNSNYEKYRFGISVGKKICNAVNRNKLKRQLRNIIDKYKKNYQNYTDYIIIMRKPCLGASFEKLEDEYIKLISLIREEQNEK